MTGQALRGFEGMVIADRADQHDFMNDGHMICNGGGLWMDGRLSGGTYDRKTSSNSFRQASKNTVRVTQDVLGSVGPIALPLVETRCMSPRPTRA